MKKLLPLLFALFFTFSAIAQDNVGIGTLNPNPKALLELLANDKGFIMPRVTTSQRLAINPAQGSDEALMVYDITDSLFYYWDATKWRNLSDVSDAYNLSLNFDAATNTLSITDNGSTLSTVLNLNVSDADSDPTNELITNVVFGAGNILTIQEGGNSWSTTINVNDADSDPTNELQNLTLSNNQLTITITNSTVDLSPYLDNTDNQTLTLSGNNLSISNGNSVSLATFLNTDNQTLSLSGNTLSISSGNSVVLPPVPVLLAAGEIFVGDPGVTATPTLLAGSTNISGVTRLDNNGTDGRYRINFTSALPNNRYFVQFHTVSNNSVNWNLDNDMFWMVIETNTNFFTLSYREVSNGSVQDLNIRFRIFQ